VGDRVRYRSDRPVPGDPGAIGTAVDDDVPQSATLVYVQFPGEAPVFVDRGMLEIVPPAPISDEARDRRRPRKPRRSLYRLGKVDRRPSLANVARRAEQAPNVDFAKNSQPAIQLPRCARF
jgi:hypothetical protein